MVKRALDYVWQFYLQVRAYPAFPVGGTEHEFRQFLYQSLLKSAYPSSLRSSPKSRVVDLLLPYWRGCDSLEVMSLIEVKASSIHGLGVFASRDFCASETILCSFCAEDLAQHGTTPQMGTTECSCPLGLRHHNASNRSHHSRIAGTNHYNYVLTGSVALINYSCTPNCAVVETLRGEKVYLIIVLLVNVQRDQELTWDYGGDYGLGEDCTCPVH